MYEETLSFAQSQDNYARLVWRSRRGMLELDLVCEPFVRQSYPHLDISMQQAYQALMECEDPYLYATLILGKPCHPEHKDIVGQIRTFVRAERCLADE